MTNRHQVLMHELVGLAEWLELHGMTANGANVRKAIKIVQARGLRARRKPAPIITGDCT
jgi:hypothetical protein